MTTNQKLEHARCLANATRHDLNSAYSDLRGTCKPEALSTVPQKVVYAIIDHCDKLQFELGKLHTASG